MANWNKILSRGTIHDRRMMAPVVGGISLTGVALLFLLNTLMGGSPSDFLNQLQNIPIEQQTVVSSEEFVGEDSYEVFASTVLGSNNDMWRQVFKETNREYSEPKLVLFRIATDSACGGATSDVGPHYCPTDQTIYLDETFFDELTSRFGARGGDVAQAYVIAHEVAHHAQNELGIMNQESDRAEYNPDAAREFSVKLELQADCFAGLWLHSIKNQEILEPNEIYEAMDAAAAVGDDRIQKSVTGRTNPETWTHGSSDQRVMWFDRGYESGSLSACNTFQ